MNLDKNALDLAYKILANVQVKDYGKHLYDVKHMILTALVSCYIKARHDQKHGKDYDQTISLKILNSE